MIAVRHRAAAVVSTMFAITAATVALPAAASAAVPGIDLQFLNVPGEFTPGAAARDITAIVAANAQAGPQCRKVRWQLVVRVQGIDPGQARVERVPEDGGSPLQVLRQGDTTRITDVRFDPKSLCPGAAGRVRAPYRVSVDGDRTGRITLESRALDAAGRVLQAASVTSKIVVKAPDRRQAQPGQATKAPAADKTSAPAATPSPIAPAGAGADDSAAPAAPSAGDVPATRTSSSSGIPSLLGPGLIVGAVLVLAGLTLLLRIRLRNRRSDRAMARRQMYQQQVYQQQIHEQLRYDQQMYDQQMYDEYDQDGYEPTEPYDQGSRVTYSGR
jgi:hypothetical protein